MSLCQEIENIVPFSTPNCFLIRMEIESLCHRYADEKLDKAADIAENGTCDCDDDYHNDDCLARFPERAFCKLKSGNNPA